jgi:hypothetical protein
VHLGDDPAEVVVTVEADRTWLQLVGHHPAARTTVAARLWDRSNGASRSADMCAMLLNQRVAGRAKMGPR